MKTAIKFVKVSILAEWSHAAFFAISLIIIFNCLPIKKEACFVFQKRSDLFDI